MQHCVQPKVLQSLVSASSDTACVRLCLHVSVCLPVCLPVGLSVYLSVCVSVSVTGVAISHTTCSGTTGMHAITTHVHAMSMNWQVQDVHVRQMHLICTISMHARPC